MGVGSEGQGGCSPPLDKDMVNRGLIVLFLGIFFAIFGLFSVNLPPPFEIFLPTTSPPLENFLLTPLILFG